MRLRLGTRGSRLAMAQSGQVAAALRAATGCEVELVEVVTAGDRSTAPVPRLGVGVFVSALREALLAKEIDFAVHSFKDLPTAPTPDLVIAAVPERADPRDALVARDGLTLAQLPAGATIGTGAVRRIAQLRALGAPVRPVPIRGNVDTRLRKVTDGELDAVILARAGLARLDLAGMVTEILDPELMLPAPAQGALAVECRADDDQVREALAALDHGPSRLLVRAERALLAELEAGCSAPVAGLAAFRAVPAAPVLTQTPAGGTPGPEYPDSGRGVIAPTTPTMDDREIYLRGAVLTPDGRVALRMTRTGTPADAHTVGRLLAADLLGAGAADLIAPSPPGPA